MAIVGFDFGTTNSLISVFKSKLMLNFLDQQGLPIPSVVCYEGTQIIVGRSAKERLSEAGLGVKGNIVRSPKMLLGRESVFVDGVERNPVDIVSDVIRYIAKEALSSNRELGKITGAVVTIPVTMEGRRRAALRDAFRLAGIRIVHFVHEPLAALYGFFRSQKDFAATLRRYDRKLMLVFDWGGGTLDLTLCRLIDGMLVQIRNDGTEDVGGDNFDETIRNEIVKRVFKKGGLDESVKINPDAMTRLLHKCEQAKIELSSRNNITIYVPRFFQEISNEDDLEYQLTREELEKIVTPLLNKGLNRIQKILDSADISPAQIAVCLATGGMANMPAIRSRLHEWFGVQRVEISERSGTLIAEGAAWIAHDKSSLQLAKHIELLLARNSYLKLIPAGTRLPNEGEVFKDQFHLYCADPRDGKAKFQICSPTAPGLQILAHDHRNPLENLVVNVDSKAKPFEERLELDVQIDDNLILHAQARSLNKRGIDQKEIHDLEFGIALPSADYKWESGRDFSANFDSANQHKLGDLVIRSNIANCTDPFLIPGELMYQIHPEYFNRFGRLSLTKKQEIQEKELLYYTPCSMCGRASNDPLCKCASLL